MDWWTEHNKQNEWAEYQRQLEIERKEEYQQYLDDRGRALGSVLANQQKKERDDEATKKK